MDHRNYRKRDRGARGTARVLEAAARFMDRWYRPGAARNSSRHESQNTMGGGRLKAEGEGGAVGTPLAVDESKREISDRVS